MNELKATILVEPTAKGRPKAYYDKNTKHVGVYTPAKTRKAEADIKADIRRSCYEITNTAFMDPRIPIRLDVAFYRSRPKAAPKRVTMPVQKPDLDNYVKLLKDALQKYVYLNDSQITTLVALKRFGSPPRIEIILREDQL